MKNPARSRWPWIIVRWIMRETQRSLLALAPAFGVPPYLPCEGAQSAADRHEGGVAGDMMTGEEPAGEVELSLSERATWNEIVTRLRRV